jgi:hypothetical protein
LARFNPECGDVNAAAAAKGLLLLDAVGCAGAAAAIIAMPSAFRVVDPSLKAQLPVAVALTGTATLCARGAATPNRRALTAAAVANAAWVAVCLAALPRRPTATGKTLMLSTAVLDGAAGGLQWFLRRSAPSS